MNPPSLSNPTQWRLVAVALLAFAPHTLFLPTWASLFFVVVVFARRIVLARSPVWATQMIVGLLALICVAAVFGEYHTLLGQEAGVGLLVPMLGLKILESRTARDAAVSLVLSYFVLIVAFLFTQSIISAVYAAIAMFLITALGIQIHAEHGSIGLKAALGMTLGLVIPALPFAILMFVLFPRLSGPIWSIGDSPHGVSGLSDRMSPGSVSRLVQSGEVAFRVTFDGTRPSLAKLYWRGPVLSRFDGRTWSIDRPKGPPRELILDDTQPVSYEVALEPHQQRWLFALEMALRPPLRAEFDAHQVLVSRHPVTDLVRYRVTSSTNYVLDPNLSRETLKAYLELPETTSHRVRVLAESWNRRSETPFELVGLALDHFHTLPFSYTLTPPLLSGDPVDQFLFETRKGFCEHYASSFVVLMRAAGIPSRVVTGYQGGEWNALGGYLAVRQADAHAWAEIWTADKGWVRIDPTTAVAPERVELGIQHIPGVNGELGILGGSSAVARWAATLRMMWDNVNYQWTRWVVVFDPQRQYGLLRELGIESPSWRHLVMLMSASLLLFLAVGICILIWRQRPEIPDPALKLYRRLQAKLSRAGLSSRPEEAPLAYALRVRQMRPDLADSVKNIVDQYIRLRYSQTQSPEHLRLLRRAIRNLHVSRKVTE